MIVVAGVLAAFRYRLYPKPQQGRLLKSHLSALCQLYNELRDIKIDKWRREHASLSEDDLRRIALDMRKRDEDLREIHSQVVQNVATRVSTAFRNYLEGRARFPKRKRERRYRSFTYPQSGFRAFGKVVERGSRTELKGRLYLSKVGHVRIFMHRPLKGRIKNLTVKYDAGGWYAAFICELPDRPRVQLKDVQEGRIKGGDLGLERFLTLSEGSLPNYPRYLRRSEVKIKRLQRVLSRAVKGSRNFRRLSFRIARLHLRVGRQREDYQNQVIAALFKENDVIILEKLRVSNMLKNHCLAKSIQDAAFGKFIDKAMFKANFLGKWFVPVDPWGTTQFCYNCLMWVPKDLSERQHRCPSCGLELNADLNAARSIAQRGRFCVEQAPINEPYVMSQSIATKQVGTVTSHPFQGVVVDILELQLLCSLTHSYCLASFSF